MFCLAVISNSLRLALVAHKTLLLHKPVAISYAANDVQNKVVDKEIQQKWTEN